MSVRQFASELDRSTKRAFGVGVLAGLCEQNTEGLVRVRQVAADIIWRVRIRGECFEQRDGFAVGLLGFGVVSEFLSEVPDLMVRQRGAELYAGAFTLLLKKPLIELKRILQ